MMKVCFHQLSKTISFDEELSSPPRNKWMATMKDELDLMTANQVLELVDFYMIAS